MRTLTVMEMDAVSGGEEKSFLQNLAQCTADTLTGAAIGAGLGAALGAGAAIFATVGAISHNLASEACSAL